MSKITFVTSNTQKAKQLYWHCDIHFNDKKVDLPEIQSLDVAEVVKAKAHHAYDILQTPVLVEDFSLQVHALGKLPGPMIKWFWDALSVRGVCDLVGKYENKKATAQAAFAYYDGSIEQVFLGEKEGIIANEPRGNTEESFELQLCFIPNGYSKTWAEMDIEEQKETSVRRIAIRKLVQFINNNG